MSLMGHRMEELGVMWINLYRNVSMETFTFLGGGGGVKRYFGPLLKVLGAAASFPSGIA